MNLLTLLSTAALLTLTHALPQATTTSAPLPSITPTGPLHLLRTCVLPSQPASAAAYNNLYVASYHTGAGLSDAFLQPNRTRAIRGFLNGTTQEFAFPGNNFPWSMVLAYEATYAGWEPVQINAGLHEQSQFGIVGGRLVAVDVNGTEDAYRGWRGEWPACV